MAATSLQLITCANTVDKLYHNDVLCILRLLHVNHDFCLSVKLSFSHPLPSMLSASLLSKNTSAKIVFVAV